MPRVIPVPGGLQDFGEGDGQQDKNGQQDPQHRSHTHYDNIIVHDRILCLTSSPDFLVGKITMFNCTRKFIRNRSSEQFS